jgi:protein OS-9
LSSLSCSAYRLFHQEKRTLSIHCNELAAETESTVTVDDDSLPKEAQISIIPGQDEVHGFIAYAT